MEKVTLLFLFLITSSQLFCQEYSKWEVGLNYSHQIRLNKIGDKFINILGNKDSGIQQLGLYLKRKLIIEGKLKVQSGVALSKERVTSQIVVNHCYGHEICYDVLISSNVYTTDLLEIPIDFKYMILPKVSMNLGIIPMFRFHQNITAGSLPPNSTYLFKPHAIEFYTGLEYNLKRINISLSYRWINLKKIDPVFSLENSFINDNPNYYDEGVDLYNPVKLRFSVGYSLGKDKKKY